MPDAHPASAPKLRWYQGVERYCWIVLAIAALGWLFDTMDQNLFNLVRAPSTRELLVREYCARQGLAFTGGAVGLSGTIRAARGDGLLVDVADRAGVRRQVEARPRAGSAIPPAPGEKVMVIGHDTT